MHKHYLVVFMACWFRAMAYFQKRQKTPSSPLRWYLSSLVCWSAFSICNWCEMNLKAPLSSLWWSLPWFWSCLWTVPLWIWKAWWRKNHFPDGFWESGFHSLWSLVLWSLPLFPEIPKLSLIMMAFILSPTDAALGQAVVTGDQVPRKIRQTINMESGLNVGIGLLPILVCIALLSGSSGEGFDSQYWMMFIAKQLILGPIIGIIIGFVSGKLLELASGGLLPSQPDRHPNDPCEYKSDRFQTRPQNDSICRLVWAKGNCLGPLSFDGNHCPRH